MDKMPLRAAMDWKWRELFELKNYKQANIDIH